jgi:catechol-2,3-dioxygenase
LSTSSSTGYAFHLLDLAAKQGNDNVQVAIASRLPSHPINRNGCRRAAMAEPRKARAMGVNHIVLEVGAIQEALAFYSRLFEFKLRGKSEDAAFIDFGDQFIALQKGRRSTRYHTQRTLSATQRMAPAALG